MEKLLDSAVGTFGLQMDDEAREVLSQFNDGTPGSTIATLSRMKADGVEQITPELARQYSEEDLKTLWAEIRRHLYMKDSLIQLDPEDAMYYRNRARTYIKKKMFSEGEQDIQMAFELAPDNASSHGALGLFAYTQKDYTKAHAAFQQAAAFSDDPTAYHFDLGLTLLCLEKPEEALELIQERLANGKPDDLKEMIPDYEELFEEQPNLPGVEKALHILRGALEK